MKLVRDNIPDVIKVSGGIAKYHFATTKELPQSLHNKMIEELGEFTHTPNLEEAADMLEVFRSMLQFYKMNMSDVERTANEKRAIRGSFSLGIILEKVVVPPGHRDGVL